MPKRLCFVKVFSRFSASGKLWPLLLTYVKKKLIINPMKKDKNKFREKKLTPCFVRQGVVPRDTRPLPLIIAQVRALAGQALGISGITPQEKKEWINNFADGALYVYRNYGAIFGQLMIIDRVQDTNGKIRDKAIFYNKDNDCVYVTRKFIQNHVETTRNRGPIFSNPNTKGEFCFTGNQIAFLLGFEETYHAYQAKKLGGKYTRQDWTYSLNADSTMEEIRKHYSTNRLERDASDALMKAAGHKGWCDRYRPESPLCAPVKYRFQPFYPD